MPNDIRNLLEQRGLPSTYDLTRFSRLIPDPAEWTLTGVLPFNEINSVKWRTSSFSRTISAAKFRAYDAITPTGRRRASKVETEGLLPPLGQKTMIGEFEMILQSLFRGADGQDLVDAVYDEAESNTLAIRARWELARGDLLTDLKFTLNENGLVGLEADFSGLAETGHFPTAGVLWSNPAAPALDDERTWTKKVTVDSKGKAPRKRIASQRVMDTLATNQQYIRQEYPGLDLDTVSAILTPQQVNNVRVKWGLPPIEVYDVTIDVDGTLTRPIPDDRFIITDSDLGGTLVGVTAEGIALTGSSNPRLESREAPGIVSTRSVEDDPPAVWQRSNAVGMPVPGDPNLLLTAKVL